MSKAFRTLKRVIIYPVWDGKGKPLRYEGTVYRPPSEAGSLLIQATIGCPHNRCRFCGMYKGKKFRIRPVKDILEDLEKAKEYHGEYVRSLFLPDGNTIIMKTRSLVRILSRAKELFPRLERITLYGSARFINVKKPEELAELREAGLSRLHMGLESGDDETLKLIDKGATAEESIMAGRKVREAGIELSVYYLVGIGGMNRWREHAAESARVISAMAPEFIRLRTYHPVPNAPIFDDIESGRHCLPDGIEAIRELEVLVEGLDCASLLVSDHVSNYLNLTGQLPDDKPDLISEIREAIQYKRLPRRRRLMHL